MRILVGTSGWQYRDWKNAFYPKEVTQSGWLEHYAQNFRTVEVNNTFYRLPERKTFEDWHARTPDDFIFTIKTSRYLTHIKRLQEPQEPVSRLMDRAAGLGPSSARCCSSFLPLCRRMEPHSQRLSMHSAVPFRS